MRLLSGKFAVLLLVAFLLKTLLLLGQAESFERLGLLWAGALTGAAVSALAARHLGKIRPRGSQEVSYRRALDLARHLVSRND